MVWTGSRDCPTIVVKLNVYKNCNDLQDHSLCSTCRWIDWIQWRHQAPDNFQEKQTRTRQTKTLTFILWCRRMVYSHYRQSEVLKNQKLLGTVHWLENASGMVEFCLFMFVYAFASALLHCDTGYTRSSLYVQLKHFETGQHSSNLLASYTNSYPRQN